jgi:hypothetical protein
MWDTIMVYIFRYALIVPIDFSHSRRQTKFPLHSSAEVTAGIVCASTPVCAAFFTGGRSKFFSSISQRYFSRLRKSNAPSGGSKDSAGRKNAAIPRRKRGDLDSESVDDLFTIERDSEWQHHSPPVELHTVVTK